MYYPITQKFVFKTKNYSTLAPVFKNMLNAFLVNSKIMLEEEEIFNLVVTLNTRDLEKNKKPEGYNRGIGNRLIFPIKKKGENIEMLVLYPSSGVPQVSRGVPYNVAQGIEHVLKAENIEYKLQVYRDYFEHRQSREELT